jgi:hypothetical protein
MGRSKKVHPDQTAMLATNQYGGESVKKSSPPRARRTDPGTSHAAARSVGGQTKKQLSVKAVLRKYGPMSDEQLLRVYKSHIEDGVPINGVYLPEQSDSGIRTRRSELADLGAVVEHDTTTMRSGRKAIRWKVAE